MILWCVLLAIVDAVRTLPTLNPINAGYDMPGAGSYSTSLQWPNLLSGPLINATGPDLFGVSSRAPNGTISLFNRTDLVGTITTSLPIIVTLVHVKDSNCLIAVNGSGQIVRYNYVSGTTFSENITSTTLNLSIETAGLFMFGTAIGTKAYITGFDMINITGIPTTMLYVYDVGLNSLSTTALPCPSGASGEACLCFGLIPVQSTVVFVWTDRYISIVADGNFNSPVFYPLHNDTMAIYGALSDNLDNRKLYVATDQGSVVIAKFSSDYHTLLKSEFQTVVVINDTALYTFSYNNILNFGPFQYLGLPSQDTNEGGIGWLYLVNKQNLAVYVLNNSQLDFSKWWNLGECGAFNNKGCFGLIGTNNLTDAFHFQTYYIEFPLCATGTQSINCTACVNGTYLYQNACYAQGSFPTGTGISSTDPLSLAACTNSCAYCLANASICTQCAPNKTLTNGVCTDTTIPCSSVCATCNNTTGACLACSTGYALALGNCCPKVNFCSGYSGSCICTGCQSSYQLLDQDNRCCLTVPNCNSMGSSCDCLSCESAYTLQSSTKCCSTVTNCNSYSSVCECLGCSATFSRQSATKCCPTIPNCSSYSSTCDCLGCSSTYSIQSTSKCCPTIPNCSSYSSACECLSCSSTYSLQSSTKCCPTVSNCSSYSSICDCLSCSPTLVLQSSTKCCPLIDSCSAYSSTCDCQGCISTYSLQSPTKCCTSIANCSSYSTTCDCLSCPMITGCTSYNTNCSCAVCSAGKTLTQSNLCCSTIPSCATYDSSCSCSACQAGYLSLQVSCCLEIPGCQITAPNCTCNQCASNFVYSTPTKCCPTLERCASYNNTTCECAACSVGFAFVSMEVGKKCFDYSSIPSGNGLNTVSGLVETCQKSNCAVCKLNSSACTECDTANGYELQNGNCVKPGVVVQPPVNPTTPPPTTPLPTTLLFQVLQVLPTPAGYEFVFDFFPPSSQSGSESYPTEKALVTLQPTVNISLSQGMSQSSNLDLSSQLVARGLHSIRVSLVLATLNYSDGREWSLGVSCSETTFSQQNKNYTTSCRNMFVVYRAAETVAKIKDAEQKAAVVSGLTSTMSSTDSAVGMSLMGTLLAADPTGTFFRFTKILQIVNKLYFININYGKRLEAFLAKSTPPAGQKSDDEMMSIRNTRGKLSFRNVPLNTAKVMLDKVVLYLISWILKGVKRLLLDNCIMGKIGIYFCHYANRAHLIIFNLVFIDFIWLAPRTLMHARDLPLTQFNLTILVMCLIAADLCLILSHLLDDRIWRKALEHYTSLREFCPAGVDAKQKGVASQGDHGNNSALPLNEPGSAPKQDDPNQDQTKQINYKKTYFEIDFNVHLMDMATNTLRVDESVFQSTLCRLLMFTIWYRIPLIQLTILSCQYANTLGLTVLLIIELSRLFATIYAYLKYKYLKNIICLLMEVSQSFFVGMFFLNALLISPKRFDELIMDFYQDAGIWIVIASCVAEYLLLLTYIGVATYDFFKNRKMMKRMNVKLRKRDIFAYEEDYCAQREVLTVPVIPSKKNATIPLGNTRKIRPKRTKVLDVSKIAGKPSVVQPKLDDTKKVNTVTTIVKNRVRRQPRQAPHQNVEASSGQTGS